MNIHLPGTDIPRLLVNAAKLSAQLNLAKIESVIFFICLQQEYPEEMNRFFHEAGIDVNELYTHTGPLVNSLEHNSDPGNNCLPLSASLMEVLELAQGISLHISSATGQDTLTAALFLVPGPLHDLGESLGLTTTTIQHVLTVRQSHAVPDTSTFMNSSHPSSTSVNPIEEEHSSSSPESWEEPRQSTSSQTIHCPTIEQFCSNWIEKAREGSIEPAIGRDEEIMRVLQILSRRTKSNPILIGEPGTGKTAIVEGLAHKLLQRDVPEDLTDLKLYQLDLRIIESTNNCEEIIQKIIDEAKQNPQIVLFIDEIHTLIGTCACSNNAIANMLKPEMARGSIKILGATTTDEYTKHIEKDKAFERRFQKVIVNEPSTDIAITMLKGIKKRFEIHHHINIPDKVVECAVKLSHRYITDRRLPDKAIDLLDEAASRIRINHGGNTLSDQDIMEVVTHWTGIPLQNMSEDETDRLRHMEEQLHQSIIGQDTAIRAVANAIRRNRMGLNDASRPIGSFLFLGTTGVGKTELCKALAEFLFHSRDMIVRIDMSEYQQEHSAARLFGAPPGYVGYEQGGQLTEAVRRKPYSLVLFDEIEKAHPKIFETLLQILDDGRMTDGQGRIVDFKNTLVIMTSNMGQNIIMHNLADGNQNEELIKQTSEAVVRQMKERVAPEFLNRIDHIIMFLPLTRSDIRKIAELQLNSAIKRMSSNHITLTCTPQVLDFIADAGYQPEYGGRPVKRAINTHIIDAVTSAIVNGSIERNRPIECYISHDSIAFRNTETELPDNTLI